MGGGRGKNYQHKKTNEKVAAVRWSGTNFNEVVNIGAFPFEFRGQSLRVSWDGESYQYLANIGDFIITKGHSQHNDISSRITVCTEDFFYENYKRI